MPLTCQYPIVVSIDFVIFLCDRLPERRVFRIPRLIDELARYAALQNKSTLLRQIAKAALLSIDDFGLDTARRVRAS